MSYIDIKYVSMLSPRLSQYKQKSSNPFSANFRCPYCGDSEKSNTRARGWVLTIPGSDAHYYYCHNCTYKAGFGKFLREQDSQLYTEWRQEILMDKIKPVASTVRRKQANEPSKILIVDADLYGLKPLSVLDEMHPAVSYMLGRKVPKSKLTDIFFAPRFKEWVNSQLKDKFEDTNRDEPRIVFPLRSRDGKLIGVTGRSIADKPSLRYITIMFDESHVKVFGLDKVNIDSPIYIVEGAIDSFFVKNCVAMAGISPGIQIPGVKDRIFVIDNEPRNYEVCKQLQTIVDSGEKVIIWPRNIKSKDINQMILDGCIAQDELMSVLEKNTFRGLAAKVELSKWRKR